MGLSLATLLLVAAGRMLAEQRRQSDGGEDSLFKYLAVFSEVLSLVNRAYVDELEDEALMSGALEGTLDALDPFSLFIPADQVESFAASREVGIRHSGLVVLKARGVVYVAVIEAGSPAAQAGLARDHIVSIIQNRRTRHMPLHQIQTILAGEPGTEIEVERIYQGQKETVRFELAEYSPPGLELTSNRGVGVLRVPTFRTVTADDVEALLSTLAIPSAELPELDDGSKLVVDLRGAAGGAPEVAYQVAGLFVVGELGALRDRSSELATFDGGESPVWQGDLVVLLDRGTQGAAEILATVLQQSAGATLVGDRSFGHCGRQKWVEFSTGARLQITDAFYTGPDREPINHSLQPDLWVRPSLASADSDEDEILERGLEV
ncbi:MAG: S41 family peptidase, partial [Thermoanaerobaculia bacterium]